VPSPTAPLRSSRLDRLGAEQSHALPVRWAGRETGIPRLPGRPERYEDYELPVESPGLISPASPSDLAGDELERWLRGEGRSSAEPTGLRIESSTNAPVTLVELEGQQGNAEVMLAGELYGVTVATRHRVDTGSGVRDYVALYGRLSRPGPEVTAGATLARGAVVGFVGDRNGSDTPHLYFEVRQLRLATRAAAAGGKTLSELVRPAVSLPCDPRNVLPLR
jgi:murein DD-endopeptidase MepM/ murein hydrolase activator NlpD